MCGTNASSLATNSNGVHQFCAGVNSASAAIQVCFFVFTLSNRDYMMKFGGLSAQKARTGESSETVQ